MLSHWYLLNKQHAFCVVVGIQIIDKKWSKKAKLVDVAICVIINVFDRKSNGLMRNRIELMSHFDTHQFETFLPLPSKL